MILSQIAERFLISAPASPDSPATEETPHLAAYVARLETLPITSRQAHAARRFLSRFSASELPTIWLDVRRMLGLPAEGR